MPRSTVENNELRTHAMFAGLSDVQLEHIQAGLQVLNVPEGEVLFSQGQPAERFFLVRHGQIKLYRLSAAGNEKIIEIIGNGQSFAEALMFMEAPRYPVNAQALVESELISIRRQNFIDILRSSVDTCFRVMGDLSVRLHHLLYEIDALTLQNATLRLVQYLLAQCPPDVSGPVVFEFPVAKNIIASRLSIQPETLSRILHTLNDKGLVSVKGLQVTVFDVDGLRGLFA